MRQVVNTTIPVGGARSGSIILNENTLVGLITGSGVGTTAFSLLVSVDGSNFYFLRSNSAEYAITAVSASYCPIYIDPDVMYPFSAVQIHQGTSASPVLQVGSALPITAILQRRYV